MPLLEAEDGGADSPAAEQDVHRAGSNGRRAAQPHWMVGGAEGGDDLAQLRRDDSVLLPGGRREVGELLLQLHPLVHAGLDVLFHPVPGGRVGVF